MAQLITPPQANFGFVNALNGNLMPQALRFLTLIANAINGTTAASGVAQNIQGNGLTISRGSGSPLNVVSGNTGDLYISTAGGSGTTFYVKESGVPGDKTGWVGK